MGLQFVIVDFLIILTYIWSVLPGKALLSISLAGRGQLVKMCIALMQHGIFSLNFAFLYISRLSLVYQIKLNHNRHKKIGSKRYFFINPKKPSKIIFNFI